MRTKDNKKRSRIQRLLRNPKWQKRSTKWIAEATQTSTHLVQQIRAELGLMPATVETKNGKVYPRGINRRFG